jgi:hypothetical protein
MSDRTIRSNSIKDWIALLPSEGNSFVGCQLFTDHCSLLF